MTPKRTFDEFALSERIAPRGNIAGVRRGTQSGALGGFLGWIIHPGLSAINNDDDGRNQLAGSRRLNSMPGEPAIPRSTQIWEDRQ